MAALNKYVLHSLAVETEQTSIVFAFAGLVFLILTFVCVLVWAALRSNSRLNDLGMWYEDRFVFREPITIHTALVGPENNERKLVLVAPFAPKFSIIYCRLVSTSNSPTLQATLQSPFLTIKNWRFIVANKDWPSFSNGPLSVAVKIGIKKEFYLEWWMPENSVKQHLQIEILSFAIPKNGEPNPQKDFCVHVSQPQNGYDFYAKP